MPWSNPWRRVKLLSLIKDSHHGPLSQSLIFQDADSSLGDNGSPRHDHRFITKMFYLFLALISHSLMMHAVSLTTNSRENSHLCNATVNYLTGIINNDE